MPYIFPVIFYVSIENEYEIETHSDLKEAPVPLP